MYSFKAVSYLIRSESGFLSKYVYNFFQSQFYWSQIRKGQIGIGQPNVNSKKLAKIMLPLPHIEEQHQIVAEIERRFAVADEIEKVTKQSIKQSQRLRQSILKQAFKGRLVPQYPDDEPASELLERIRAEKAKHDNEKSSKKIWKRKTKQRHVCRQAEGSSNG